MDRVLVEWRAVAVIEGICPAKEQDGGSRSLIPLQLAVVNDDAEAVYADDVANPVDLRATSFRKEENQIKAGLRFVNYGDECNEIFPFSRARV
mmetsp:Transcript_34409/g.90877  ORF Transcript_34409/g.90877 Transcript_34409/m.90877 type:complete len:93 (-) Transcript_34409:529-807(-)